MMPPAMRRAPDRTDFGRTNFNQSRQIAAARNAGAGAANGDVYFRRRRHAN